MNIYNKYYKIKLNLQIYSREVTKLRWLWGGVVKLSLCKVATFIRLRVCNVTVFFNGFGKKYTFW
jgi:hypothetical protein